MMLIFEFNTGTICTCHLTRYVQHYTKLPVAVAKFQLMTQTRDMVSAKKSNFGSRCVWNSSVRSLKFLTPTPLLLSLNIFQLRSDWRFRKILKFCTRLLVKLQIECYKLLKYVQKMTPAPAFCEKINSGSTPILEIH